VRTPRILAGVVLGATVAAWVAVVTAIGLRLAGLPFPPFDLFDWEARVLPGAVLGFTVETIVALVRGLDLGPTATAAKLAEHAFALVQFVVLGALVGIVLVLSVRRRPALGPRVGALIGAACALAFGLIRGALGFAVSPVLAIAWLAAVLVSGGALMGVWVRSAADEGAARPEAPGPSRRRLLYWTGLAGLAAALGLVAAAVLRRGGPVAAAPGASAPAEPPPPETSGPAVSPDERTLAARIEPAPGTRPEVTPVGDFYRVDIDSLTPRLDPKRWRLEVGGLVVRPASFSLDDLRALPSVTQAITLSCISNPVGGDLISTGFVTGVPLRELLARVEPAANVTALNMRCADGFYESMALATAMDGRTLLVLALDGAPLPAEHGAPARIYIPGRYGMKQPKWITSIALSDQARTGYWVERGWDRSALVRTTSVVDTPRGTVRAAGPVAVGGIAYSGERGISRVEIQVDGGDWQPAALRVPPLSPLTWVQWRANLRLDPGDHTIGVRAYDGSGRLQVTTPSDTYPSGATGLFTRSLTVRV
jgi:DMSO/TMAO reductase YedYZ molybdopterin-dependent catalytic subunit